MGFLPHWPGLPLFWWRLDNVLETQVQGLLEQARRQGVQEGSPLYGLLQRGPRLLCWHLLSRPHCTLAALAPVHLTVTKVALRRKGEYTE